MLCTVPEGLPRKGTRPRAWQEIRLLASQPFGKLRALSLSKRRQGSVEATCAATFESVQQAGVRWGHTAKEAGRGMQSRIHAVCDGAEWIAIQTHSTSLRAGARSLRCRRHTAYRLLSCERIPRRRRARVPPRSARAMAALRLRSGHPHTQPFDKLRAEGQKRLKRGASAQVIQELAVHREAAAVADENAPVRAAHRYLSNRPGTLDYASAIAAELPIGSGLIESGHKHVLQARLKIPGAAWLPSNAETMAQLRVLRSNDRWSELWPLAA